MEKDKAEDSIIARNLTQPPPLPAVQAAPRRAALYPLSMTQMVTAFRQVLPHLIVTKIDASIVMDDLAVQIDNMDDWAPFTLNFLPAIHKDGEVVEVGALQKPIAEFDSVMAQLAQPIDRIQAVNGVLLFTSPYAMFELLEAAVEKTGLPTIDALHAATDTARCEDKALKDGFRDAAHAGLFLRAQDPGLFLYALPARAYVSHREADAEYARQHDLCQGNTLAINMSQIRTILAQETHSHMTQICNPLYLLH